MITTDEYVAAIKSALVQAGKKLVMEWLVSRFPFFSLGLVNPLMAMLVGKILEIAFTQTELGLYIGYVNLKTTRQGQEFEAAALASYKVQKSGSPKEKQDAEKALIDHFRIFVKFNSP